MNAAPPLTASAQLLDSDPIAEQQPSDTKAAQREQGLRDAAFQAAAQGGGENYFSAFALLLHASPFQIGILSALPQLVGMISQLSSVKLLQYLRKPERLVVLGGWGQALSWVPLLALPLLLPSHGPWMLIACAILYFAFGHATAPAWNSLLIELTDPDTRGTYFAQRARITALVSFLALGAAGTILTMGQAWGMSWLGFVLIFLGAASARLGATRCQARVAARTASHGIDAPQGFRHFLTHRATPDFRRFILFSGLVHWAVLISGPFFVIYLLRDLHWTYLHYAGWMAASILGQFTTLKPWGQFGDRYGNKNMLLVTAFAVPVLPMAYLVSEQYLYLLGVNFFGGIVWAGLSLGLQNYVFDSLRPEERTRGVALANAMNAIGWGLGALTGSWLATVVPTHLRLAFWDLTPASNLPFVFFLSGLLRLAIAIGMLGRFGEPRRLESTPHGELVKELPLIKVLVALWPSRHPR